MTKTHTQTQRNPLHKQPMVKHQNTTRQEPNHTQKPQDTAHDNQHGRTPRSRRQRDNNINNTDPGEKSKSKINSPPTTPEEFQIHNLIAKTANLDWICFPVAVLGASIEWTDVVWVITHFCVSQPFPARFARTVMTSFKSLSVAQLVCSRVTSP